jgi:molybdate transport system permease protein
VGFALLLAVGAGGPVGRFTRDVLGFDIAFTWRGVVVACAVVAFPLLVRSVRTALEEVDPELVAVARSLGRSPLAAFVEVELPLAWRGVLAGTVLAFTRALGEFGATIVVAGNIPGRTQTLALALFHHQQMGEDREALAFAGIAALIAFAALFAAERLVRGRTRALLR